jgi:hypothetical protein
VTWSFVFLAFLLLGLAMAATSGLLRRLGVHRLHALITMPAPEHHSAVVHLMTQRASIVVAAFGVAGLLALGSEVQARLVIAAVAALVGALVALLVLRPTCPLPAATRGRVVRAIAAGSYGQVEVDGGNRTLVLAARADNGAEIPLGASVEVVDCESSVLTVRLVSDTPAAR